MPNINSSNSHVVLNKSVFLGSLTILIAIIGSFAFSDYFKASGHTAEQQKEDLAEKAAQSCCSQASAGAETHTLVGSYYSLKENQETMLMFNNKGPEPLVVSPTFYGLNGERLDIPALTIPATSYQEVEVRELLAGHLPQFEEGSLQVTHQGMRLQLGTQFKILKGGILFDEQFITPATRFPSQRMENVWWMPSSQSNTKFIVSNTTNTTVTTTIKIEGTAPRQQQPAVIRLNPHQTRVLDVIRDVVGHQNGTMLKTGGISITHDGSPGAIMARMLISNQNTGFSTIAGFVDPTNQHSSKLNGGGLRLGAINGDELEQIIVARNVGDRQTTIKGRIPYTNENGDVAFVTVPEVQLNPGEVQTLAVKQAVQQANVPASVTFAGLELEYTTTPGSVVFNALSVSRSGQQVFQVPLLDPEKMPASAGGFPWKVDEDYNTVVFIKNETDTPKKYIANLIYEGGGYSLGVKVLKPRQTIIVDFKSLRDNQTPDSTGKLIPLNIDRGQIAWSMSGSDNKTVSGRSEQVNTVRGVSSTYACYNCCPDSFFDGRVTPSDVYNYPGDIAQFAAMETTTNCFGYMLPEHYADIPYFTSSDYDVAWANYYGSTTAMDQGLATITATWTAPNWRLDLHGYMCENHPIEVVRDGYMEVLPKVLDVSANGATRVTQVVGDANILHFVTPKGAPNSQVTLSATVQYRDIHVPNDIEWEGAVESPNNPFQATLSKDTALRHIVRIKYQGRVLKELRVWVVWSEITSNIGANTYYNNAGIGRPQQSGGYIVTDIAFTFTIQPLEIITDSNRPNFSGANTTSVPGGTHPFFGGPLSGGANRKWDSSRQMRVKIINPANISSQDQSYPPFFDISNYPTDEVEGNDDQSTDDPECNNPYSQEGNCTNSRGTLTGKDNPKYGIRHSAGTNGDIFEIRLHFREFARLEIEGSWKRISDYYPWKDHIKFIKQNGLWVDNGTAIALDNNGF